MARLPLILMISWICAGCAASTATLAPILPHEGRTVRVLAPDPATANAMTHSLLASPPFGGRQVVALGEPGCHRLSVAGRDGVRVSGAEVVAAWEAGLRFADGAHAWLLRPVVGAQEMALGAAEHVPGLTGEENTVEVCVTHATPDWPARLQHPALWLPVGNRASGGGAFRRSSDGRGLVRVIARHHPASVARVEIVEPSDRGLSPTPAEDGFDLAILRGGAVDPRLLRQRTGFRSDRVPGWDVVYALWLNDTTRWTNDPTFRRWLGAALDREDMVRTLFGGQAEAADGLIGVAVAAEPPARRPFSTASLPRLTLGFDQEDPHAGRIAARVKALLEQEGLELRIEPHSAVEVRRMLAAGRAQMAIVVHRPPVDDPLLGLLDTLWPLHATADEETRLLLRATGIHDRTARRDRAAEIEAELIERARLLPLIRLPAWLILRTELTGVEVGPFGVLRLERAEWRR